MKTIWTLLFLTLLGTTFGLALMFTPEAARTEKFWLAIGAIGFAEFLVWMASTFRGTRRGEQAAGLAGLTMVASTIIYFLITVALGFAAFSAMAFKLLLAFHIVALLAFAFLAGIAAIGTRALQGTKEAARPR